MVSDESTPNAEDSAKGIGHVTTNLADLVGDILESNSEAITSSNGVEKVTEVIEEKTQPKKRKFKPKGMFLGTRRDNGEPIDISSTVLARHAAMLGSTGSGKTVMAKALIEEATLAKIPSLIIDPQGDLARLALGIEPDDLEAQGGDYARAKKLMDMCEVRIWTPLRSKGLPLCIDPFNVFSGS